MIALHSVTKSFGQTRALDGVSLAARKGETVVLIGPSGCGKSTLLRTVNGLVTVDRGEITIDATPLDQLDLLALRRRTGYVIQGGALFPHKTARDNVAIVAASVGWTAEKTNERTAELCTLTHFPESHLTKYPSQLSGGQQQRVALMRALMLDAPILLLDEPLGALDPMIRSNLQTELRATIRALEKTVLFVTHDLAEADFFADRIVLMNEGRVEQTGSLEHLATDPADNFVEAFVNAQRVPEVLGNRRSRDGA